MTETVARNGDFFKLNVSRMAIQNPSAGVHQSINQPPAPYFLQYLNIVIILLAAALFYVSLHCGW